jgi:hypothetical protein
MLTPGILQAYQTGISHLAGNNRVRKVASGQLASAGTQGEAALFETSAAHFMEDPALSEEIFGAASLVIRCPDIETMLRLAEGLEGQLTATIQMDDGDLEAARLLVPVLERRVGRILVNGYPTGVEVAHARCMAGRTRPRRTGAPPRSALWRSRVSCVPSATRTCRRRCCRRPCATATRWGCGAGSTASPAATEQHAAVSTPLSLGLLPSGHGMAGLHRVMLRCTTKG